MKRGKLTSHDHLLIRALRAERDTLRMRAAEHERARRECIAKAKEITDAKVAEKFDVRPQAVRAVINGPRRRRA